MTACMQGPCPIIELVPELLSHGNCNLELLSISTLGQLSEQRRSCCRIGADVGAVGRTAVGARV